MPIIPVRLSTAHAEADVRGIHTSFEMVGGIQLPNSVPRMFNHHAIPTTSRTQLEVNLSEEQAQHLQDFAEECFVGQNRAYDCGAFVGYVMGWDNHIIRGANRGYSGPYIQPDHTQRGRPYLLEGGVVHMMLGTDHPDESLSVLGYEGPLVVAKNTDLLRAYGSTALVEITRLHNLNS